LDQLREEAYPANCFFYKKDESQAGTFHWWNAKAAVQRQTRNGPPDKAAIVTRPIRDKAWIWFHRSSVEPTE